METTQNYFNSDDNISGLMSNEVLAKIAKGEIDFKRIAELTLAGRGCNRNGVWVGFEKAEKEFSI